MRRQIYILVFLVLNLSALAQTIQIESNTLAGSKGKLPFWLWANQLGRYEQNDDFTQHFGIDARYQKQAIFGNLNFDAAANIDFLLANENSIRFTELFGSFNWKVFQFKMGAFAESEEYEGLSASNGNLANTRNARPHPRIKVGFNRFVPLGADWFSIYGFYEEGLLNDDRYVDDTHLHHKAFYIRVGRPNKLNVTGGIEHYVMWGGTHPSYGELPGWESYFDYITGKSGDENALLTDQLNVLGNQYGTYQLKINKEWINYSTSFYISHPFDDRSGLELVNYQDNLYGVFIRTKAQQALIEGLVIEYYHTTNQSGAYHLVEQEDGTKSGRGRDDYFNHGIYRSGVTYQQHGIVSPLFGPVSIDDSGISTGFESTRFTGVHFGANGSLSSRFIWKAMMTYTRHLGRYITGGVTSFDPARKQASGLLNIEWRSARKPLTLGASFAGDHGSLYDDGRSETRLGVQFSAKWLIAE